MKREDKLELARAYVQGLLDEDERSEFERLMQADVELASLTRTAAAQSPKLRPLPEPEIVPTVTWPVVERRDPLPVAQERERPVTPPRPSFEPPPQVPRRTRPRIDRKPLLAGAAALALLACGYGLGLLTRPASDPFALVVLQSEADANPVAIVQAYDDGSVRLLPMESFIAPQGSVIQLWTLPDMTTGLVSLGTFDQTRDIRLPSNGFRPRDGQRYQITLEAAPGSPTGRPSGPVIARGFARLPF